METTALGRCASFGCGASSHLALRASSSSSTTQDIRGTCLSNGSFELFHKQPDDGYDTLQWIAAQAWSDGNVYTTGGSADAISSMMLLNAQPEAPPQLKKQLAIFVTAHAYETFYPGGALRKSLAEFWIRSQSYRHGDVDKVRLIQDVYAHEIPGGVNLEWWKRVELDPVNVRGPAVFWGGWYDIFQQGTLDAFHKFNYETAVGSTARGRSWLFMDPCGHCQAAASQFPQHDIAGRAVLPILLGVRLFASPLNGPLVPSVPENVKRVTFYVLGTNDEADGCKHPIVPIAKCGNYFTSVDAWPTYIATPFYLNINGVLEHAHAPVPTAGEVSFLYDPANPVPTKGGDNLNIPCGPLDQTVEDARDDVLTFDTAPLGEAMALAGPIDTTLHVSTVNAHSGAGRMANDTDFTVKLSDVSADGKTVTLIKDGVVRMMWRSRGDPMVNAAPQPIDQGAVYQISVVLHNTSYVFAKGHRVRVSISSSNFPRFSLNANNGFSLQDLHSGSGHSNASNFVVVKNTIHLGVGVSPSAVYLPIVPLSALPPMDILAAERDLARSTLTAMRQQQQRSAAPAGGAVEDHEVDRFLATLRKWSERYRGGGV